MKAVDTERTNYIESMFKFKLAFQETYRHFENLADFQISSLAASRLIALGPSSNDRRAWGLTVAVDGDHKWIAPTGTAKVESFGAGAAIAFQDIVPTYMSSKHKLLTWAYRFGVYARCGEKNGIPASYGLFFEYRPTPSFHTPSWGRAMISANIGTNVQDGMVIGLQVGYSVRL